MNKCARAHDMSSWLRDPRIAARGFAHRWQSTVAAGNGEDAFIDLVDPFLRRDSDLLDLGCGHGELILQLAARCRTIVGIYDYSLWWLDVPEFYRTPHELYARLNVLQSADAPAYQAVEPQLKEILKQYGTPQGIVLRHQRLLWQVYL